MTRCKHPRPQPPRSRRQRPGFTLVELVAVTLIIALVAGIAIPRMSATLVRHRINAAAKRVAVDFDVARRQARLTSSPRIVIFFPLTETYEIQGMQDPDKPTSGYIVNLAADPYRAEILTAQMGTDGRVVFDGYGNVDEATQIVLQIGSVSRAISLNPSAPQPIITAMTD